MGRASAGFSASGQGTPVRRRQRGARLRLRRRRSPTPTSHDATTQELIPSSSAASFSQQLPPYIPDPEPDDAIVSYAAVAPLPVFRGDPGECPDAHVARFERVCRANGAVTPAAAARIFPASLDGDAGLWHDLTASSSSPPWHDVRAAFLDFFRAPGAADLARADLVALRQGSGEGVNRYHLRMQGILRRCADLGVIVDISGAFLKDAFVDGLRGEFQDWVSLQQPETLDEAVALALTWERAGSVREARRAAKAACAAGDDQCAFCGEEGHDEARCEVRTGKRELWLGRSTSSGRGGAAAMAVVANDGEQAEEGGGRMALARLESAVSTRSTQCQCRKHQCGKKSPSPAAMEVAGGSDVDGVVWDE
ncbi:hypothetical protein HU200_027795 [Digitaria exilis]|uniref:Retrotransposon gag domain-containing protein n=1 Tax=Digitaria exilis TaxID=1010633 RepID=A0A835C4Y5_9POAL|nr:hypothetical protein HU200_027795 [Digitaria exilis]CAB3471790.1 unnamed protein product [Digitaria exilis]